jgi:hypothetical protein
MKPRNLFDEIHINPINRDLLLIAISSFLVALAFGTVAAMLASRF